MNNNIINTRGLGNKLLEIMEKSNISFTNILKSAKLNKPDENICLNDVKRKLLELDNLKDVSYEELQDYLEIILESLEVTLDDVLNYELSDEFKEKLSAQFIVKSDLYGGIDKSILKKELEQFFKEKKLDYTIEIV